MALISNCIYIQGALNTLITENTIKNNSIPIKEFFTTKIYNSSAHYKLLNRIPLDIEHNEDFKLKADFMKESSPVIVRFGNNINISFNIFENNSMAQTGSFYFGAAIVLNEIIGKNQVNILSNLIKNYQGLPEWVKLINNYYYYEKCSFPAISINFILDMKENSKATINQNLKESNVLVENCTFENISFTLNADRVFFLIF